MNLVEPKMRHFLVTHCTSSVILYRYHIVSATMLVEFHKILTPQAQSSERNLPGTIVSVEPTTLINDKMITKFQCSELSKIPESRKIMTKMTVMQP